VGFYFGSDINGEPHLPVELKKQVLSVEAGSPGRSWQPAWFIPYALRAVLLKTSEYTNTTGGGVIYGNDLPVYRIYIEITADNGYSVTLDYIPSISFSGSINIVPFTCQTPADVVVNLGEHNASEFSGTGSALEWVDASIRLTSCPGEYHGYGGLAVMNADKGLVSTIPVNPNYFSVGLFPGYGFPDYDNGVIGIRSGNTDARGVGIQIGLGTTENHTVPTLNGYNNVPVIPDSGSSQVIPLVARLIQVSSPLKGGDIYSFVTYTITYY
jgi:type 1 fimbria pilin